MKWHWKGQVRLNSASKKKKKNTHTKNSSRSTIAFDILIQNERHLPEPLLEKRQFGTITTERK